MKRLRDDAAVHECHPYAGIMNDYAELLAVSITSMNGNFFNLIEQFNNGKHKCSEEEFRHIERLWSITVKALEHTIDTAQYFNRRNIVASIVLCKECMNETNRLLASGWGTNIIGEAGTDGYDLTKLLAKASEIYAASISKAVKTLVDKVSSIEDPMRKEQKFSKETFLKMENFCKNQADASYGAAEISAYFKNLVRSLKNKK